jgi:hypothetical protein
MNDAEGVEPEAKGGKEAKYCLFGHDLADACQQVFILRRYHVGIWGWLGGKDIEDEIADDGIPCMSSKFLAAGRYERGCLARPRRDLGYLFTRTNTTHVPKVAYPKGQAFGQRRRCTLERQPAQVEIVKRLQALNPHSCRQQRHM